MIHSTQVCIPLKPLFSRHKGAGVQFTDEPTGNLDKENRRKIVELLQQIAHEQDRCVIVVTHSDYVKKKCDICYEMGDDDEE